ncbi:MAG: aminotransferase class IV [Dokdonella sp.]|uniref:aminotransferase class IV n=1 Tax=Dokdonella sp. TaxID=2291710 RepID=UPI0025C2416F|nr:aminotransferase class IV [Dokdonella sp.]MBZ0223331.1 aminotransferase class IV [Dokdonella sp.]MCC7254514.1 aminotransferase class IV [Dokdonella sp.]
MQLSLNGEAAPLEALAHLAGNNYGHFTAAQARGGRIQGLSLHLDRLQAATRELFGNDLDLDLLRGWLRALLGGQDASVRISVFSLGFDRDHPAQAAKPDVLITLAPPRGLQTGPLRTCSVPYDRDSPHIKHLGSFGLFNQRRLAQLRGFDDALFVTADGHVAEGTIWNVGFREGEDILWPAAPMLEGISMQLLKAGLARIGVAQTTRVITRAELPQLRSAFFTNSACAAMPIACIDEVGFDLADDLPALLRAALDCEPWVQP